MSKRARTLTAAVFLAVVMISTGLGIYLKIKPPAAILPDHVHQWNAWEAPVYGTNVFLDGAGFLTVPGTSYTQLRRCTNCGLADIRLVTPLK